MSLLRKILVTCTRWFGAALLLASVVSIPSMSQTQELASDINEAEELWATVWTNGDKETYRAMLAEEFTWTFVTGQVNDKEQAVEALTRISHRKVARTTMEALNSGTETEFPLWRNHAVCRF